MGLEDKKNLGNVMQNVILENRSRLSITGVVDVLSFDDLIVILETELGLLTIKGENIKINKLSIDSSEVVIEGDIFSIAYSNQDVNDRNSSFMKKLFK